MYFIGMRSNVPDLQRYVCTAGQYSYTDTDRFNPVRSRYTMTLLDFCTSLVWSVAGDGESTKPASNGFSAYFG